MTVHACEPHFRGAVNLWLESDVARRQFNCIYHLIRVYPYVGRCERLRERSVFRSDGERGGRTTASGPVRRSGFAPGAGPGPGRAPVVRVA